jgi:hypothetical protein
MPALAHVTSTKGRYTVLKHVGGTEQFTLYLCTQEGQARQQILKIATATAHNALLDREAYLLSLMRDEAHRLEQEYAAKVGGKKVLNYDILFPDLAETFLSQAQGRRRVSVVSFKLVEKIGNLTPIGHIAEREMQIIDPRTSAWMIGKLLKLLQFAHDFKISVGKLSPDNILIERDQHYVTVFDWTAARLHPDAIPIETARSEISQAVRQIFLLLGGDLKTGKLPEHEQLPDSRYAELLHEFIGGTHVRAYDAFTRFYEGIRGMWPKGFHPYTSQPV